MWHYFARGNARYEISVEFREILDDGTEQPLAGSKPVKTTVSTGRQSSRLTNQSKGLDFLRFGLAVLTATFALTSLRQILPNADALSATIGALALGFSADTIKNLITKK